MKFDLEHNLKLAADIPRKDMTADTSSPKWPKPHRRISVAILISLSVVGVISLAIYFRADMRLEWDYRWSNKPDAANVK